MKIMVTESQFHNLTKLMEQTDECRIKDIDVLNNFLDGVITLDETITGDEVQDNELMSQIKDSNQKYTFEKITNGFDSMDPNQLKDELKKILSVKNLQEQDVPYLEQTMNIGGVDVPKAVVHGIAGLLIISILSKLLKSVGPIFQSSGGSRNQRLRSRAVGCQGANARAKLIRKRRRRENWRTLMRKLGLR